MATEKVIARKRGARLHPRSGSGAIKDDASSSEDLLEIKDANVSHTLKAKDLLALYRRAVRKGLRAKYIIYFQSIDVTCTITMRKGKG